MNSLPRAVGLLRRRRMRLVTVGAGVAVMLGTVPASGSSSHSVIDAVGSHARIKAPGFYNDPDLNITDSYVKVNDTTAASRKAKVQFKLPTIYTRGNVNVCFAYADSDGQTQPSGAPLSAACRDLLGLPLPAKYRIPDRLFNAGLLDAYVVSSPGPTPTYGDFPPVRAEALAFGVVPVSATVRLSQHDADGFLSPLRGSFVIFDTIGGEGSPSYPGFPTVPIANGKNSSLVVNNSISGLLDVRLSDIRIDGVRVEAGRSCRTTRPAQLKVRSPLGFGTILDRTRGTLGGFVPSQDNSGGTIPGPGYFDGSADIPPFTGCVGNAGDISRILTAFLSGPSNPVSGSIEQSVTLTPWCTAPVANCTATDEARQQSATALTNAISANKSPKEIAKIAAKLKPSDYKLPKVKDPKLHR